MARETSRRRLLSAAVAAAALPVAGCVGRATEGQSQGGGAWPTYKFDAARSGHAPDARAPTDGGTVAWETDLSGGQFTDPILSDGTVYFGGSDTENGLVHAVDAASGDHRWTESFSGWIKSPPTAAAGGLYAAGSEGTITRLDYDGERHWTHDTGTEIHAAVCAVDGTLYVGGIDFGAPGNRCNSVVMIDAVESETNDREWRYDYGDSHVAAPAVADGRVHVASNGTYAVDADDGELLWTYETGDTAFNTPAVVEGRVFVSDWDGTVHALGAGDGTRRWQVATGATVQSAPAVADGTVVVGTEDGTVRAFDADTGDDSWQVETGGPVRSTPAIVDQTAYVGSVGAAIHAVDLSDGSVRWTVDTDAPVVASPAVAGGTVYAVAQSGRLYAISE